MSDLKKEPTKTEKLFSFKKNSFGKRIRFMYVAAGLVLAILTTAVLLPMADVSTVYAVERADYPNKSGQIQPEGYADGLEDFFTGSIREFLKDADNKNLVYSPINVYMALGMLAEITDGNSRQQILEQLHAKDMDALRTQASCLWNGHYRKDKTSESILANSLWLNEDIFFDSTTLQTLADTYYASSFQGEIGSDHFNKAMQSWVNKQTGGLLKEQARSLELKKLEAPTGESLYESVIALISTIYFYAEWGVEFLEKDTTAQVFHAESGDIVCDFMRQSSSQYYYWGKHFSATGKSMRGSHDMWFILPDEGSSVEEVLGDQDFMDFILENRSYENNKFMKVHLSVPKFDVSFRMDLIKELENLGVTDVFDLAESDFSSLTQEVDSVIVSEVQHSARVKIDEKGCTATAYTYIEAGDMSMRPPDEEIDFVLDRPFLFLITGQDGLPMFVGVVNQP